MNDKVDWWPRQVVPRNEGPRDLKFGEVEVPARPKRLTRYGDVTWSNVKGAGDYPIDFLRKSGIPVFVKMGTGSVVVRSYRAQGNIAGLVLVSSKDDIRYFRLDDKTLVDLVDDEQNVKVVEFRQGGLIPVLDAGADMTYARPVDFERCFLLRIEEFPGEPREAWELGFSQYQERAFAVKIRIDRLWLFMEDVEKLMVAAAPVEPQVEQADYPYPEGFSSVPAVHLMFQAAYRLNVLKSLTEEADDKGAGVGMSVYEFLRRRGPIFSHTRATEAEKFVKMKLDRRRGRNLLEEGEERITLGSLESAVDCREISDYEFVSEGLRALIVAADWWTRASGDRKSEGPRASPGDLLRILRSMSFRGTELVHLIALINGGTKWNGTPVSEYLREDSIDPSSG